MSQSKWKFTRSKRVGTAALGIPMFKETDDAPRFLTGTNKEANEFRRALDEGELNPDIRWNFAPAE